MKRNKTVGAVHITLDTDRLDKNLRNAQKKLDMQVLNDTNEYVPMDVGALRESAYHPKGLGGGVVAWNTPYAHYQYMGELYLAENGSSWAKKHETKYPAGRPLHYGYPNTGDHWFETAKETHKEEWTNIVRREMGKG